MKVAFQTLGCRVNFYDSEAMIEMFKNDGYELVDFNEFADVNDVTIIRNNSKNIRVRLKNLMNGKDVEQNLSLVPGDYVVVSEGIF